jgi:hypothetical protein
VLTIKELKPKYKFKIGNLYLFKVYGKFTDFTYKYVMVCIKNNPYEFKLKYPNNNRHIELNKCWFYDNHKDKISNNAKIYMINESELKILNI